MNDRGYCISNKSVNKERINFKKVEVQIILCKARSRADTQTRKYVRTQVWIGSLRELQCLIATVGRRREGGGKERCHRGLEGKRDVPPEYSMSKYIYLISLGYVCARKHKKMWEDSTQNPTQDVCKIFWILL